MAGTRVLRIGLKAIVGMMRWPFPEGTTVRIHDKKLPADCTFIKILKVEEEHVQVLLASNSWSGHRSDLLPPPQFKYVSPSGHIVLPTIEDILKGAPN